MKPYYYVLRKNSHPPTVRHATLALAQAETERLANQHTGETFEILKAVATTRVSGPASTVFMDGEGPVSLDELNRKREELGEVFAETLCNPGKTDEALDAAMQAYNESGVAVKEAEAKAINVAAHNVALADLTEAKRKCAERKIKVSDAYANRFIDRAAFNQASYDYNQSLTVLTFCEVTARAALEKLNIEKLHAHPMNPTQ